MAYAAELTYEPLGKRNIVAGAAIAINRFVSFADIQCGLGIKSKGVADLAWDSGDLGAVVVLGTAIVEYGGTIAIGDPVTANADGKAIKLDPVGSFVQSDVIAQQAFAQSDTTMVNITNMNVAVAANEIITGRILLRVLNGDAAVARSIKFNFTKPAGSTLYAAKDGVVLDLTSDITEEIAIASGEDIWIDYKIANGATAGTLQLQAAPNASVAEDMSIEVGSFFPANSDLGYKLNGYAQTAGVAAGFGVIALV